MVVVGWLSGAALNLLSAAAPSMRPYVIDLPNHTLRFSLPEEIAKRMSPLQADPKFDPKTSATYERDGFRGLASKYYQFQGPFWVGAYGALRFDFRVVRREKNIEGNVTTLDALDRYVRRWLEYLKNAKGYAFGQLEMSDSRWVFRRKSTFGQVAEGAEEMQGFSCPIDETMFLDVGFWITETVPGSITKWKSQAEAFREAIKATIVLQPKAAFSPGQRAGEPVRQWPRPSGINEYVRRVFVCFRSWAGG